MRTKQCIILAGGLGSRLGNISKITPKPLIKINNIPFLFYLILKLKNEGITNILILTWHKSEQFNSKKISKKFGIDVRVLKESKKLGTGGSIINSFKYLHKKFFIVNGDTLFDISFKDLEKSFLENKKINIMTACYNSITRTKKSSYVFYKDNIFKDYTHSNKKKFWVSGGVYISKKIVFKNIEVQNLDLDNIILKNQNYFKKLGAKKYYDAFIDIGTPSDLKRAKNFIPKFIKYNIQL